MAGGGGGKRGGGVGVGDDGEARFDGFGGGCGHLEIANDAREQPHEEAVCGRQVDCSSGESLHILQEAWRTYVWAIIPVNFYRETQM